jgi:hypothetical protein
MQFVVRPLFEPYKLTHRPGCVALTIFQKPKTPPPRAGVLPAKFQPPPAQFSSQFISRGIKPS